MNNGIFAQDIYGKVGFDAGLPRPLVGVPSVAPMPYHYPGGTWSVNLQQNLVLVYDTRYGTNTTITLPLGSGPAYNVLVDWGDGNVQRYSGTSVNPSYSYNSHGVYIVQISGSLTVFGANFTNPNANKLIKCLSFGSFPLTSLAYAFGNISNVGCPNLTEVPKEIPSTVTQMAYSFAGCTSLNDPNISSWNVSNVTNMLSLFNGATAFNQPLGNWNVSNVTNMGYMLQSTRFNQPIGSWDVSKVTSFRGTFNGSAFNQDISGWNTINVTDMSSMFSNYCPFNQNIGGWNTAKVTDMGGMFFYNQSFNQNIGAWNTAAVTNMSSMFQGSFFNNGGSSSIGSWTTGAVTTMQNMFASATAFNQDVGSWNVSNVISMGSMFQGATAFSNAGSSSISAWNTSKVTLMDGLFRSTSFNQPLSSWDVSKVTSMYTMLFQCPFSQSLAGWNLASIGNNATSMQSFLAFSTLSTANYDATLIDWNNRKSLAVNGVANWATAITPHFGNSKYTAGGSAATARAALVSYGWTITDGGSV